MSESQTEQQFRQVLADFVAEDPKRFITALVRALEENGGRCLVVLVGVTEEPQVRLSLSLDDVTMETVKQVVRPVLQKAGFPSDVVPVMAGAAGSAAMRWLSAQRQRRQQEQAARTPPQPASPPKSEEWSPTTPSADARPAWRPGPRR